APDVQPRSDRGHALRLRGPDRTTRRRPARTRQLRRVAQGRAGLLRSDGHLAVFITRPPRAEWLRGRVPDFQRRVPARVVGHSALDLWSAGDGNFSSDDIA